MSEAFLVWNSPAATVSMGLPPMVRSSKRTLLTGFFASYPEMTDGLGPKLLTLTRSKKRWLMGAASSLLIWMGFRERPPVPVTSSTWMSVK